MRILVTAGNTLVPIDRVRCITNIFRGRTGAEIALRCHENGHTVTFLTSHPETVAGKALTERWTTRRYRTFQELQETIEEAIRQGGFDVVIHSAAVSDYQSAGVYAPGVGTRFRLEDGTWRSSDAGPPALVDRAAGKVKSDEPELWLRLVRTPKLIDLVRTQWGFTGILVKFKLEVGASDDELLEIAEASRRQSAADLVVANTLEGASFWAYLGPLDGAYQGISRRQLPERLLEAVERLYKENSHG
jgi:phosphopantothenoylcysteine synthetase/decarboxylase